MTAMRKGLWKSTSDDPNNRYPALATIALGLRILAGIIFVFGLATAIWYLFMGQPSVMWDNLPPEMKNFYRGPGFWRTHISAAFWEVIETLIRSLLLFAASEGIYVVLDIEKNTRTAAQAAGAMVPPATPQI